MKKIIIFILFLLISEKSFTFNTDSLKLNYSIRAGIDYSTFSPIGVVNILSLIDYRIPFSSTINPTIGISFIKANIFKKYCCDFIRVDMNYSIVRSELITHFPDDVFKNSVSAKPIFFYTSLNTQYGFLLGEKWRLGPVLGMSCRTGSIIKESDKLGLMEFGIYDIEKGFTDNFKRFDISLGLNFGYKFTPKLMIQGDLHHGVLPQIILKGLPKIYQYNLQLTLNYLINSKKS